MNDLRNANRARNLALTAVAGLAGCSTVIIVVGALLVGLWLDAQLDQRGPLTILLIVLSAPVSLGVMLLITFWATRRIRPSAAREPLNVSTEEADD